MSCNYHAEIINLSQKNHTIFKHFTVLGVRKRFLGFVKIYTINIPEENIAESIKNFQENMSCKINKEWYITIHNTEKVIVVFRKKSFELSGKGIVPVYQQLLDTTNAAEKEKWDEIIAYAKSLGIPDDQCDFLPEDFKQQNY